MKSSIFSSASSSKLPPAAATASLSGGGSRDRPAPATGDSSCYFPGCRKDTNCHCEICLASINATLDLIPSSSSITKVSYLRSKSKSTPQQQRQRPSTAADPAMPATPPASPVFNRSTSSSSLTPPMESTAKSRPPAREVSVKKKRSGVSLTWALILLLCFSLLVFLDLGFLKGLLEGFGPRLTREMVNQIGEESRVFSGDLKGKVRILELKIGALVGEGVSNCSSLESKWEMDQQNHHFLFRWNCVIYESMAEKVSVWGSPLRTCGKIIAGFSSKSFILLSGRITEWSDRKLEPILRPGNGSSWILERMSSTAVLLEKNTWVLMYERNSLFEGPRLLPAALKLMLRKGNWRLLTFASLSGSFVQSKESKNLMHPT